MAQTPGTLQQQTLKGPGRDHARTLLLPGARGTWLSLFGLLGGLLRMALPVQMKVTVPLTSITAIGRGRIGLLRDVFFIEATDGKTCWFRPDYQPWLETLTSALQTRAGASLTQKSDDRWEVGHP